MSDLHDEEIVIQEPTVSVGEQLKLAREAKKMTVGEIAAQLRFTQETIINLEAERWEKLHGRAYARGYFLSYVKFLGLPEHDMLAIFNLDYKTADNASTAPRMFEPKRASFPWLQILLVIAVITATWFAFQQWQHSQSDSAKSDVVSQLSQFLERQKSNGFASSVVEPLPSSIDNDTSPTSSLDESLEESTKEPELQ